MTFLLHNADQIKRLEISLIVISSFLLGIWAVKDTIALRNILLVCGALGSIFYSIYIWRTSDLKKYLVSSDGIPFLMVVLSLLWVILHYLFLSRFPEQQWDEMDSTWLRAMLAVLLGFGTGLALQRRPLMIYFLWLGILASFSILFFQYIPKALAKNSLFAPDFFGYIFHVKINAVLIGLICFGGLGGSLLDYFFHLRAKLPTIVSPISVVRYDIGLTVYVMVGITILFYSYVFIFDTKNGVIGSLCLLCCWTLICFKSLQSMLIQKKFNLKYTWKILFIVIGFILTMSFFLKEHSKFNIGWQHIVADIKVGVQIDQYPNWKHLAQMGYPKNEYGQPVAANTYERVAWATAGMREIMANPLGAGVLKSPYIALTDSNRYLVEKKNQGGIISTHSALVEFGLAYGLPFLGFVLTWLITIVYLLKYKSTFRYTAMSLVSIITLIYLIGEVSSQHGVEIFYYFLTFIPALVVPTKLHERSTAS